MGNCISKIDKDHIFAFEEFMKNDILFSNGITRFKLEVVTGGRYMGVHSIKKFPEKITLAYWGVVVKKPFLRGENTSMKMKRSPCKG